MNRREFIGNATAWAGAMFLAGTGAALAGCAPEGNDAAGKSSGESSEKSISANSNQGSKKMKIVILKGSPRRNGNSNHLAARFAAGATEAGHEVKEFDCAHAQIHGCIACEHCGCDGDCVFKDDYAKILPDLIAADMVVLATPVYYYSMSAQIKAAIDRFYARNAKMMNKKSVLLLTYADGSEKTAEPIVAHYKAMGNYLKWEDKGMVIAKGVWEAGAVKGTPYPEEAYQLGKSIA